MGAWGSVGGGVGLFLGGGIGLYVGWGGDLPGSSSPRFIISDWWGSWMGDCGIAGISKCEGPLGVDEVDGEI